MKKTFLAILLLVVSWSYIHAAEVDDNQIIDSLNTGNTKELQSNFKLKTFNSCEDMEEVMWDYIKNYWKNNKSAYRWWGFPIMFWMQDDVMEMADSDLAWSVAQKSSSPVANEEAAWGDDYSKTNTQVDGVDESDIIKTDGTNTYYYNATEKAVYIIANTKVVKKINLPKTFYSAELYVEDDRLVIISTGYSQIDYAKRGYYINRNTKTYTMVFDTQDIASPKLLKLYVNDGNYSKSRKIGDYVYVLSNNYFNIPYYNFTTEDDISITPNTIIPRKIEISKTDDSSEQNLTIKWKSLPYNVDAGTVANCKDIEYILPDDDTIKKYSFNPSYNIISIININDTEQEVETKVIAGSNNEVYMSLDNLYLTSNMYTNYDFSCPIWGSCFMPFYYRGENTLVHKMNINNASLDYQDSTIIPGNPLTQYSMDENKGYFRIITQNYYPERSSSLYILDDELKLTWSLTGLGKTEDFKSSRFIGDKLFLVTFEVIDPLFAIDVSDPKKPEILGELKIPGYSSYLHPYDDNHLIWLGQSTEETEWGWARTDWLKVDLYEVNYDKKCGDTWLTEEENKKCASGDYKWIIVKQKYTMNLGQNGSYSEALNNPRMFIWNKNKELLLLPVQLYKNEDPVNEYRRTDFFQGLSLININKDSGIEEKWRITHIDTSGLEAERAKECSKYAPSTTEPVCKELIGWGQYCAPANRWSSYVPEYCFVDSSIWEYIANRSWNFNKSFVKRALYIWDTVLSVSDDMLQENNINTLETTGYVKMK